MLWTSATVLWIWRSMHCYGYDACLGGYAAVCNAMGPRRGHVMCMVCNAVGLKCDLGVILQHSMVWACDIALWL